MFTRAGHRTSLCCDIVGEGSKREQCRFLHSQLTFSHSPATHNQIGPFWCWFPCGWVCVCSRTLWVSPVNSPVRLGVSPAASTPTGVFSRRFEALFPHPGALGCAVCLAPQLFLPVYPHAKMGPPGPPANVFLWGKTSTKDIYNVFLLHLAAELCPSYPSG